MTDTKLGFSIPAMYFCADCLPQAFDGDDPIDTAEAADGWCVCEKCGATLHGEDRK